MLVVAGARRRPGATPRDAGKYGDFALRVVRHLARWHQVSGWRCVRSSSEWASPIRCVVTATGIPIQEQTPVADEARLVEAVRALRQELLRDATPPAPASGQPPRPGQGSILVVDDDPESRGRVKRILSDAGHEVHAVGSALEARAALRRERIAVLITEVSMPGETGLDLLRYVISAHPETITLLASALDDPTIARAAMELGAHGYLGKPVSRSEVLIGVASGLRRRDAELRANAERDGLKRLMTARTNDFARALERLEQPAERSRALHVETIHRLARAAEHREPGIGLHLKRFSRYCGVLGRSLGIPSDTLELASVLHDVGTSMIPESILLKPGPLTVDERLAIETHAGVGYELLRDSGTTVLDLAAVIAWTHHERFDGGGYPRGLAGTEIPLEGRIAAVADVFDALTCDRSYRQAWTVDAAVAWMRRESGAHFDPDVVDALLESMDEILAIRGELAPE
jgi:putative two-component system response regulator